MRRSKPLYIFGLLILAATILVGSLFLFAGFKKERPEEDGKSFWQQFLEKFDWNDFDWENFPWGEMDDFPWNDLPWDNLPEDFDWGKLPWDNLPEDFPWDKIPWENPPENFPWDEVPWKDVPLEDFSWEDFPWDKIPWGNLPEDFDWGKLPWENPPENFPWDKIPWGNLPEDFDWGKLPWENPPEDFPWDKIPWGDLPEDFDWGKLPWENPPENFPWDKIPWGDLPEDFPWDKIPWENLPEDFPWDKIPWENLPEDFPWDKIPWENLPENFPWDKIPWENLPENFPWDKIPWEKLPENFPWDKIPWEKLPENFPWGLFPWEKLPKDFDWSKIPWGDLPEDFPWEMLPWGDIPQDAFPDGFTFPENFYPDAWDHEHRFSSEWRTITPANCGENGEAENICDICHKTVTKVIHATGIHIFGVDGICKVCEIRRLILGSGTRTAEYNGKPLTCEELTLLPGSASLLEGHKIDATFDFEELTEIGKVENRFRYNTVRDAEGNDVGDRYYFEEKMAEYGTLTLIQRRIVIETESRTFEVENYLDTTEHTYKRIKEGYKQYLAEGDSIADDEIEWEDGQIGCGETDNRIRTLTIRNASGTDVTENYAIEFIFGKLTVIPKQS